MRHARVVAIALGALVLAAASQPALAAWPNQPTVNLPVCTATGNQGSQTIVSDGAGGAIVAWYDNRGGATADIYAEHILASGILDPAWPVGGRAVCTATNNQFNPTITGDGAGGAIISWYDLRSGVSNDIYAQHVLASGAVDPAWPIDGRAICTAANDQISPMITTDGAGGAIISWYDLRSGVSNDIYAQHVLASGAVDPAWPVDGRALCTAAQSQTLQTIVSDGSGGAIVAWQDLRSGLNYDIYAQHVLGTGAVDPAWPVDGVGVCTAVNAQMAPMIASDGAGGALITWYDLRSSVANDIYAEHVTAAGYLDGSWPVNGRAVCTAIGDQISPVIVGDGAGGAIIAWQDIRGGASYDIYAQHVVESGGVDPAWPLDGRALCTAANGQLNPMIESDGAGGAIVTWMDARGVTSYDIYAQHVLATGAVDSAWPVDGRAVSTASQNQQNPVLVSDGAGGAIVTWVDGRGGSSTDIYAQRVARFGYLGSPEAIMAGVKDVPNDNGGKVKVSWNASYLDLAQDANLAAYDVYRSVPPNTAAAARTSGSVRVLREGSMLPLDRGGLFTFPASTNVYAWEFVATVNPNHFAAQYSLLAPTAFDSLGAGNPKTAFLVLARNSNGSMFWPSRPDSGYSVDNVPPVAPAPFTANYATGTAHLHWNPNTEADLAGYRLYRGTSPSFTPSPATLVATPPDTGYADVAVATYTYKLTAVDVHGNESPVATITPTTIAGVDGPNTVVGLALAPASPNPASRGTALRFALPASANVSLGIYDAAGRLVRMIVSGSMPAGEHTASWDLHDGAGRSVVAGLYFVRLEVAGRSLARRIAVTQ